MKQYITKKEITPFHKVKQIIHKGYKMWVVVDTFKNTFKYIPKGEINYYKHLIS